MVISILPMFYRNRYNNSIIEYCDNNIKGWLFRVMIFKGPRIGSIGNLFYNAGWAARLFA